MEQYEAVIKLLTEIIKEQKTEDDNHIPVGISNRHVHLSQAALDLLFGPGYKLTQDQALSQPGQYACKETVSICGPKGAIEKVRVLGPVRGETQVEILAGDCFKLGIKAPLKPSGDLSETPSVTLVGLKGSVQTEGGVMVAQRHIHILPEYAKRWNVHDGEIVKLEVEGPRGGILDNTIVRVSEEAGLECHVDTEEANAFGLTGNSQVRIIKSTI